MALELHFWFPNYKKDQDVLGSVSKRATSLRLGLDYKPYEETLEK